MNPWIGFAHPDHQVDELEPLVRTLRYALIDLQKFWVELQSIPVFKSGLSACSLDEIEKIFHWVANSPEWSEQIEFSRLVPELSQPETRKRIQEFARSVVCARAILDELNAKAAKAGRDRKSLDELWKTVSEAKTVVERRKIEGVLELKRADLDTRLSQARKDWSEINGVLKFFSQVSEETGAPMATHAGEGIKILRALEAVAKMPEAVQPWRNAHILETSKRVRLQAWSDRARPIQELRKRLDTFFKLDSDVTIDELSRLAETLRADGLFAQFKAPYKEALEKYRTLLQGGVALKMDSKNNGFQKAEKLKEWISFMEQVRTFAAQAEAKQAFAPHFQGIDTDFASALEANAWAKSVREEFLSESSETPVNGVSYVFDSSVIEFILTIPQERIAAAVQWSRSPESAAMQTILESAAFAGGGSFSAIEQERKKRCWDFKKLRDIAEAIDLSADVPMKGLSEIALRTEEAYFLIQRIESDPALQASLKEVYAGMNTDLSAIEPCAAYVKAVRSFQFPAEVEGSLLSAYGPQRLSDARSLVIRCQTRVATLHEHFRRLEGATREEARRFSQGKELEFAPLVDLMDRVQTALKNAQYLAEAVAELRAGRDAGLTGLKIDRDGSSASHEACLMPTHHESGSH